MVKLLIIDGIHEVHHKPFILESIVTQIIGEIETKQKTNCLIGLLSTSPKYEDMWLYFEVDDKKGLLYFDNRYHPCLLAQ